MEAENAYLAHAKKADVAKGNLDGFVYASHSMLHLCMHAMWHSGLHLQVVCLFILSQHYSHLSHHCRICKGPCLACLLAAAEQKTHI